MQQMQDALCEEQLTYAETIQAVRKTEHDEQRIREELHDQIREHGVQRKETENKSAEASQYQSGMKEAENKVKELEINEQTARETADKLTSELKLAIEKGNKADVESADWKTECEIMKDRTDQQVKQLISKYDDMHKEKTNTLRRRQRIARKLIWRCLEQLPTSTN